MYPSNTNPCITVTSINMSYSFFVMVVFRKLIFGRHLFSYNSNAVTNDSRGKQNFLFALLQTYYNMTLYVAL